MGGTKWGRRRTGGGKRINQRQVATGIGEQQEALPIDAREQQKINRKSFRYSVSSPARPLLAGWPFCLEEGQCDPNTASRLKRDRRLSRPLAGPSRPRPTAAAPP